MLDRTRVNIGWYIVVTEPNSEIVAAAWLNARGFAIEPYCYVPTQIRSVWAGGVRHRRRRLVTTPIFPGYIFVPLRRGEEQWTGLCALPGVRDLLRVCGTPMRVPQSAIDALKIKEGELALPPKMRSQYRKGQAIEIMEGPFRDLLGPIEKLDGKGRVEVMLDIFGRQTPVTVHEAQIKAIDKRAGVLCQ